MADPDSQREPRVKGKEGPVIGRRLFTALFLLCIIVVMEAVSLAIFDLLGQPQSDAFEVFFIPVAVLFGYRFRRRRPRHVQSVDTEKSESNVPPS